MPGERITVAVLGPGGVGGLLAALLARFGDSVLVLAGEATARAIASNGIRVESQRFGSFTVPVKAATFLSEPVDAVLVTVKATQLAESLDRVPASTLGDGVMIPFLNGLDHVEVLRRAYGPSRVVPATIRIETTRVGPGIIRHTSPFAAIEIGSSAQNIATHLQRTGLDVRVRDDEAAMLWEKFALLAPMALLTTHERASVGVIRARRREDLVALVEEAAAIAWADGVSIDPSTILGVIDAAPEEFETSMQRDQAARRPLELDAIGGALLRHAQKAGIDAPITRRLVDQIEARSTASTSA